MEIPVDVQPVVLAGEDDRAFIHERDVEALRVLHLALERVQQLPVLREHRQVEVVVVVGDKNLPGGVDADADRVVGDALAADLALEDAVVVEHLDAVRPVVADENLLLVVDHDAVGELEVLGAAELAEHVAHLVEDDDAHHFALDDDDAALAIDRHPARVLQDVGAELAHELPVLVVDLHLLHKKIQWFSSSPSTIKHLSRFQDCFSL